jgi:predicted RNA-binding Zn-ribbon protein involved in translation (DUF1610 family)
MVRRLRTSEIMQESLARWSELKKQPRQGMQTVGSIQQRISEELQILEPLLAAGCSQIADEPFDVRFMIQDRKRLLREMENIMDLHFPMPMTIRCFKCGKVFEVAFTSEERHEFPCPTCGEVEVYDLGAMRGKALAAMSKTIRKSTGGK